MKKKVFFMSLFIAGAFAIAALNTACEEDPKEACEQDLFCNDVVEVTACCTDGANCYYTYGGVEYPNTDQGLLDLIEALDCTTTKSVSINGDENSEMIDRLQALLEAARMQSKH